MTMYAADATAASFDCKKAKAPDEIAVCKNPGLSASDSEMGGLWYAYDLMPMAMGSSGARTDDARQFLIDRAACAADTACLRKAYAARIEALRGGIKQAIDIMAEDGNATE